MSISFDKSRMMFHLQTPNSSYILFIRNNMLPLNVYYGKKLDDATGVMDTISRYYASCCSLDYESKDLESRYSSESLYHEYPFYGSADPRKPAFHAQYKDGSRITKMTYVTHRIFDGKPALCGLPSTYCENDSEAQTLELEFKDSLTGLVLVLRYTAFTEHDAIARSVYVKNEGIDNINIKAIMSASIDFNESDFDFIHLHGTWARERHIERKPLFIGTSTIQSRRGSSSHHHSPFFALARKNTTEQSGEVYGFSFVYSGNFEAGVEVDNYCNTRAFMGINPFDFNWLLESGESFTAPEVIMVYSNNGIGGMSRTYHKLYRTRLARGKYRDTERPVLINNWEGTYFNFDEQKIIDIASRAKKGGVELMVLDDGWFGKRNNDKSSLGDWFVNKEKLPNGIDGLAKKINDLGMKFGLWFEPEMVSPISELYEKHPDWCIHVNGRGRSEGRNQLILDLSRVDVQDYIIGFMTEHLTNANISYIKWDMNRYMTEIGSELLPAERQSEVAHRYMLGLYRVLETITSRFPDVLFEGCASGGGRFDAGMMHYFSQYWTSDDSDAIERLYIQEGTSLVMPSVFMGAHVSECPNHQTKRTSPMQTRGYIAMTGTFGYELDVTKMSDEDFAEMQKQVTLFKELRHVFHKGDMYRLSSPINNPICTWEYISEDKNTVVTIITKVKQTPATRNQNIKLCGLEENSLYKKRGTESVYSGAVLMNCGLHHGVFGDFSSDLWIFDKI